MKGFQLLPREKNKLFPNVAKILNLWNRVDGKENLRPRYNWLKGTSVVIKDTLWII